MCITRSEISEIYLPPDMSSDHQPSTSCSEPEPEPTKVPNLSLEKTTSTMNPMDSTSVQEQERKKSELLDCLVALLREKSSNCGDATTEGDHHASEREISNGSLTSHAGNRNDSVGTDGCVGIGRPPQFINLTSSLMLDQKLTAKSDKCGEFSDMKNGARCGRDGPITAPTLKYSPNEDIEFAVSELDSLNQELHHLAESRGWKDIVDSTNSKPVAGLNLKGGNQGSKEGIQGKFQLSIDLEKSLQLLQSLVQETNDRCHHIVDDNRLVENRIGEELTDCQSDLNALRASLSHTQRAMDDLETSLVVFGSDTESNAAENANAEQELELTIHRLREENIKLTSHVRTLQREIFDLQETMLTSAGGNTPENALPPGGLLGLHSELKMTKESLDALKSDRKRLNNEKVELLGQMKDVYETLEGKDRQLRDFIRQYEDRMRDTDMDKQQLIMEKDSERAKLESKLQDTLHTLRSVQQHLASKDHENNKLQHQIRELQGRFLLLTGQNPDFGGSADDSGVENCPEVFSPSDTSTQFSSIAPSQLTSPSQGYASFPTSPLSPPTNKPLVGLGLSQRLSGCPLSDIADIDEQVDQTVPPIPDPLFHRNVSPRPHPLTSSPSIPSSINCSGRSELSGIDGRPIRISSTSFQLRSPSLEFSPVGIEPSPVASRRETAEELRRSRSRSRRGHFSSERSFSWAKLFGGLGRHGRGGSFSPHVAVEAPVYLSAAPKNADEMMLDADLTRLEMADALLHARGLPIVAWKQHHVLAWVHLELELKLYALNFQSHVKSGIALLSLTDAEMETTLHMMNSFHRKKLKLAIEEYRNPALCKYPSLREVTSSWVVASWLPSIGLPQFRDIFGHALVDGRLLDGITKRQLDRQLGISKRFHQVSIMKSMELLRHVKFDVKLLAKRRVACDRSNTDLLVWSNQRFVRWAKHVDLQEYADNLTESGVNGAVAVLDPTFSAETLASCLGIPVKSTMLRKHVALEFNPILQEARSNLDPALAQPLNRKRGGGSLGRSFTRSYTSTGIAGSGGPVVEDSDKPKSKIRGSIGRVFGFRMRKASEDGAIVSNRHRSDFKGDADNSYGMDSCKYLAPTKSPIRRQQQSTPRSHTSPLLACAGGGANHNTTSSTSSEGSHGATGDMGLAAANSSSLSSTGTVSSATSDLGSSIERTQHLQAIIGSPPQVLMQAPVTNNSLACGNAGRGKLKTRIITNGSTTRAALSRSADSAISADLARSDLDESSNNTGGESGGHHSSPGARLPDNERNPNTNYMANMGVIHSSNTPSPKSQARQISLVGGTRVLMRDKRMPRTCPTARPHSIAEYNPCSNGQGLSSIGPCGSNRGGNQGGRNFIHPNRNSAIVGENYYFSGEINSDSNNAINISNNSNRCNANNSFMHNSAVSSTNQSHNNCPHHRASLIHQPASFQDLPAREISDDKMHQWLASNDARCLPSSSLASQSPTGDLPQRPRTTVIYGNERAMLRITADQRASVVLSPHGKVGRRIGTITESNELEPHYASFDCAFSNSSRALSNRDASSVKKSSQIGDQSKPQRHHEGESSGRIRETHADEPTAFPHGSSQQVLSPICQNPKVCSFISNIDNGRNFSTPNFQSNSSTNHYANGYRMDASRHTSTSSHAPIAGSVVFRNSEAGTPRKVSNGNRPTSMPVCPRTLLDDPTGISKSATSNRGSSMVPKNTHETDL